MTCPDTAAAVAATFAYCQPQTWQTSLYIYISLLLYSSSQHVSNKLRVWLLMESSPLLQFSLSIFDLRLATQATSGVNYCALPQLSTADWLFFPLCFFVWIFISPAPLTCIFPFCIFHFHYHGITYIAIFCVGIRAAFRRQPNKNHLQPQPQQPQQPQQPHPYPHPGISWRCM